MDKVNTIDVADIPPAIMKHFAEHEKVSYVHVETLLVIYKWHPELKPQCIDALWNVFLINFRNKAMRLSRKFDIGHYWEDILHSWFLKFIERLDNYRIPCIAPFPAYIDRYCELWMSSYLKVESKKTKKYMNRLDDYLYID